MKIKQQKQLNLAQLIEYVWNNEVTDKSFICKEDGSGCTVRHKVTINKFGKFNLDSHNYYKESDLFKVEIEEEITEDTVIPKLMTTFKKTCLKDDFGYQRVRIDESYSIKLMLNRAEEHKEPIETLHVVNDDGTHTLIWREGKLVE